MNDLLTSETFETVMGGLILLFLLALAIKIGPLRFIGETLAHLAFKVTFVVLYPDVWFEASLTDAMGYTSFHFTA